MGIDLISAVHQVSTELPSIEIETQLGARGYKDISLFYTYCVSW